MAAKWFNYLDTYSTNDTEIEFYFQVRWSDSVQTFREQAKMLPGDVLLVASFISYLGCFTKQYRLELFERKWIPYLKVR